MGDRLKLLDVTDQEPAPDKAGSWIATAVIRPGSSVCMHFSLSLENGEILDTNFDKQPVTFTLGDGNLLAGFERVLLGLEAGTQARFTLSPEQAFGRPNEDNIQKFPQYHFPADMVLEEGVMVAFGQSATEEQAGVIVAVDRHTVTVDFNHPLADRTIVFAVEIISVDNG